MAKKIKECEGINTGSMIPLLENEREFLTDFFKDETDASPLEQIQLIKIFNRVYNQNESITNMCGSCWRDLINKLRQLS
jgi:hypothetical protein